MSNTVRKRIISQLGIEKLDVPWAASPVESWKSASNSEWEKDIQDFRRRWISSGTLNPPDRPREKTKDRYPDEKFLKSLINSLLLIKFFIKLETHSMLHTRTFFKYVPELHPSKYRKFSIPSNYLSEIGSRMSYYSHRIRKLCTQDTVIVERGAGFGALARYLQGNYFQYIIVDLPENLILASQYLEEAGISHGTMLDYPNKEISVFLLTGGDLVNVNQADIIINTMSMQHMTKTNLDFYFQQIERLEPNYLYLVNRNIKRDQTDIEIQNYPIPRGYLTVKANRIFSRNYCEKVFIKAISN
jgi:hypothetical protein